MKHSEKEVIKTAIKIFAILGDKSIEEDEEEGYLRETLKAIPQEEENKTDNYWRINVEIPIASQFSDSFNLSIGMSIRDEDLEPICYHHPVFGHPPIQPSKISKKDDIYFLDGDWLE